MSNTFKLSILSTAICLLAACSTTGNAPAASSVAAPPAPAPVTAQPTAPSGLSAAELAALHDPANPLSKRSVYFDLDSNIVKQDYRSVVEAHGKFLAKKPGVKITIRGNTDERGSREYNLALGQRRADATRQALAAYGVPGEQIETVSYGSEKPVAEGHSEESWAKNRRADIAYPGE
ncbi:MAG: peptidoglycan-associated lipoprotein Pal [Bacteroidota bacterium]